MFCYPISKHPSKAKQDGSVSSLVASRHGSLTFTRRPPGPICVCHHLATAQWQGNVGREAPDVGYTGGRPSRQEIWSRHGNAPIVCFVQSLAGSFKGVVSLKASAKSCLQFSIFSSRFCSSTDAHSTLRYKIYAVCVLSDEFN